MKFLVIIVASVCANLNFCQAATASGNHDQVGRSTISSLFNYWLNAILLLYYYCFFFHFILSISKADKKRPYAQTVPKYYFVLSICVEELTSINLLRKRLGLLQIPVAVGYKIVLLGKCDTGMTFILERVHFISIYFSISLYLIHDSETTVRSHTSHSWNSRSGENFMMVYNVN